jgi:hypothetical protein
VPRIGDGALFGEVKWDYYAFSKISYIETEQRRYAELGVAPLSFFIKILQIPKNIFWKARDLSILKKRLK